MAWVKVAKAGEVPPGRSTMVRVGNREFGVFNVDGALYCIDNECPHASGPLDEGYIEGEIVTCPWHAWQVNVRTGEVLYIPGMCTATFPCKEENGEVLIEIG